MQTTLKRCWNPPEIIIPTWSWQYHAPVMNGGAWWALYCWSDSSNLDPFSMYWFDMDGVCDNWEAWS